MKPKTWVFIILLCLILLAVAGIFITSKLGLVNYQKMLSTIPLVDDIMTQPSAGSMAAEDAALKQENESLKMQVQTLQEEVAQSQVSSTGAVTSTSSPNPGTGNPVDDQAQQEVYKNLADYYANMQPESAVAILDNQDPQVAAAILHEMDQDQAGQILAAMDPAQAAKLLKLIADIDSKAQTQAQTQVMSTE